jgi:hypothetical protein
MCAARPRQRSAGAGTVAGEHHVGLEDDALEKHPLLGELGEHRAQGCFGDLRGPDDRVIAVLWHLGLNDRHDARLWQSAA